jgi:hypothetical protein
VQCSAQAPAPPLTHRPFQLNSLEIQSGKPLKVNVSVPNTRLFVGNIPKSKSRADILAEFEKLSGKEQNLHKWFSREKMFKRLQNYFFL